MDGGGTGETTGSAAGASAYDVSAQSWRRAAELRALAAKLTDDDAEANRKADYWERRGHSFGVGADGEAMTGEVLDGMRAEGWVVLHDIRWPGRQRANIDHVAIGPGGILVIDSKNWSGRVDVRDEALRWNGYSREREVAAAADAALAVLALLPADLHACVKPLICLTRDEPVHVRARDVDITSTASLASFLRSLPPQLSPARSEKTVRDLQEVLSRPVRLLAQKGAHPVLRAKSSTRRVRRQRVQRAPSKRAGSRRPSKKGQQGTLRTVVVLGILAAFILAPADSRAAAIEWFSDTVGGVLADAVIPEPTTTTPASPGPSSSPPPSSR